jgi:hypothetical protein
MKPDHSGLARADLMLALALIPYALPSLIFVAEGRKMAMTFQASAFSNLSNPRQ